MTEVKEMPFFHQNKGLKHCCIGNSPYLCIVKRQKDLRITQTKKLRKEMIMLVMFSMVVMAAAAAEAMYICKNANVLRK